MRRVWSIHQADLGARQQRQHQVDSSVVTDPEVTIYEACRKCGVMEAVLCEECAGLDVERLARAMEAVGETKLWCSDGRWQQDAERIAPEYNRLTSSKKVESGRGESGE